MRRAWPEVRSRKAETTPEPITRPGVDRGCAVFADAQASRSVRAGRQAIDGAVATTGSDGSDIRVGSASLLQVMPGQATTLIQDAYPVVRPPR